MTVSEELLNDIKDCLDITWEMDDGETKKMAGMIARGMEALQSKIGTCDFETDTPEKSLLIDYVRYDRSEALADFWKNYRSEILSLQINRWVATREGQISDFS